MAGEPDAPFRLAACRASRAFHDRCIRLIGGPEPGSFVPMFCSRCGSEVSEKSRFCPSCGLDLFAATPVAAIVAGQVTDFDMVRDALASEYEIIAELGRGGMALVYRAMDRQLEREVAIKVLPFSLAFDGEFVERFQREARTAAQLEHPNIIPIYRVGQAGRVIYFVMKYLRGGALSNVIAERQRLTPPEIRRMLLEAGSALGYSAQRGIVHRDIKPDNIMFDEFGQCVLTDFGIAKAASGGRLTGTGMSIGTPHYMSPEQARAQAIDGRSDIYSLGIVAYQCLTGTVPYDGEDSFSIGYQHITEPVPVPQLSNADERRIFEVIKRMMMKDPADRFQTCEELIEEMQGQPIAAPGALKARSATVPISAQVAAVGAGAGALPGAGARAPRLSPQFASQSTVPISAPTVDRRKQLGGRRATPRRVADRSLAMRSQPSHPWLWTAIAVVGGLIAAAYYYFSHGFASSHAAREAALRDSVPAVIAPPVRQTESRPSTPVAAEVARDTVPAAVSRDSGSLKITGLPAGSTVMVDERQTTVAITRLPAGAHIVAISAPLRNFFVDTVHVPVGDTFVYSPTLTRLGEKTRETLAPAPPGATTPAHDASCEPGAAYNASRCFDERPAPTGSTFVPVPVESDSAPLPSVRWVKVSREGRTLESRPLKPSNDTAFERLVETYVKTTEWRPARKGGAPVDAWTQWIFKPAARP